MDEGESLKQPEVAKLPNYWHFAWMFFMQPASLYYKLKNAGIDEPNMSLLSMWEKGLLRDQAHMLYLKRMAFLLFFFAPACTCLFCGITAIAGFQVNSRNVALAVTFVVALGAALGFAGGLAMGVAMGVAGAVTSGVAIGVNFGVYRNSILGLAPGVVFGIVFNLTIYRLPGFTRDVASEVKIGLTCAIAYGMSVVITENIIAGLWGGIIGGLAFLISYSHAPIAVLENLIFQISRRNLNYAPPLYHELSYFPIFGLRERIVSVGKNNPHLAMKVIEACFKTPGHKGVAREATTELFYHVLKMQCKKGLWQEASDLAISAHPEGNDPSPIICHFRDIARQVNAAIQPEISGKKALGNLDESLNALDVTKLPSARAANLYDRYYLRHAPDLIHAWRKDIAPLRAAAAERAKKEFPNPFIASATGMNAQTNRDVFRGREAVIARVERIIAEPQAALIVVGPRRSGKTSLLTMLQEFLPRDVMVFIDLTGEPGTSVSSVFQSISRKLADAMRRHTNRAKLPKLVEGSGIEEIGKWLDDLENAITDYRVVFCIDEYERIEGLFQDEKKSLNQLLGVVRYSIQHRHKVKFLFAGASPIADMQGVWADHFISSQEVRLDFLSRVDSMNLLHKPTADFPDTLIPLPIAEKIYEHTAGQPSLLQRFGYYLVAHLGDVKRNEATLNDVELIKMRLIDQTGNEFADYKNAPYGGAAALESLARGQTPDWQPNARNWLRLRGFITIEEKIRIPMFQLWLTNYLRERE